MNLSAEAGSASDAVSADSRVGDLASSGIHVGIGRDWNNPGDSREHHVFDWPRTSLAR